MHVTSRDNSALFAPFMKATVISLGTRQHAAARLFSLLHLGHSSCRGQNSYLELGANIHKLWSCRSKWQAAGRAVEVSLKIAGVHWWYNSRSHAAEMTAGYYNTESHDGYAGILELCAQHGMVVTLTCVEMCDAQHPPEALCGPEGLLRQVWLPCWLQITHLEAVSATHHASHVNLYAGRCCTIFCKTEFTIVFYLHLVTGSLCCIAIQNYHAGLFTTAQYKVLGSLMSVGDCSPVPKAKHLSVLSLAVMLGAAHAG